jgi:hypothetical protein
MFLGNDRLLNGVHATDSGTVAVITVVDISRTYTLEPSYFFWFLMV